MDNLPIILDSHINLYRFRKIISQGKHRIFYRVENQNISGPIEADFLKGKWFSDDLDYVLNYLRKNQKGVDGTKMQVLLIPYESAEDYHISKIGVNGDIEMENNNYIFDRNNLPNSSYIIELGLDDIEQVSGNFLKAVGVKSEIKDAVENILK